VGGRGPAADLLADRVATNGGEVVHSPKLGFNGDRVRAAEKEKSPGASADVDGNARPKVDGERIRRLCAAVESRLDAFSDEVTDRVRAEIPSYVRLPLEEQRQHVRELTRLLLTSLAEGAEPTAEQLRFARAAARRRAYFGMPVGDVLATFHIFSLQLWEELRSESDGVEDSEAIVALLDLLWVWVQAMTGIIAEVYTREESMRHGREVSLRQRLLEALRGDGTDTEQADDFARELGFDPDGSFQAVCAPVVAWPQEKIELLQRSLSRLRGLAHCGHRDELMVVLAQGVEVEELTSRMTRLAGDEGHLGVGLIRNGFTGAASSIGDAERALWVARIRGAGIVRFEDAWLSATLSDSRERLEPLLTEGRKIARENPSLAATVNAFSRGFSLVNAARELTVHPNTAAYRLNRWQKLTGWDPRSLSGLLLSIAALELPPVDQEPPA
jgi:hypothetical protein